MKMKSLKISRDEAKLRETLAQPEAVKDTGPRYPWGLEITLDKDTISKLGINVADYSAGDVVEFTAKAEISSISKRDTVGSGADKSMGLQITDLAFGFDREDD